MEDNTQSYPKIGYQYEPILERLMPTSVKIVFGGERGHCTLK